ncbi:uncharacterized protein LOC120146444 [Hibiscus syriacus]|uniref:uncharacterized protein LOC120146444 n=1 Tax=Hibiscus syriacus TaxID=106335 RepID=UPI001922F273|nr:uncharacterized protein LOC120146444 [Hibiscus syriacus]
METHISGRRLDRIINSMGYNNSFRVEAQGHSGGIWVLWDNSVEVKILNVSNQYIHAHFRCRNSNYWEYLKAVYASPNQSIRKEFWELLSKLKPDNNAPWILGGDFNYILKPEERLGSSNRYRAGSKLFQDFIFNNELIDVNYQEDEFTWRRGNLWQRLDRCLMNIKWLEVFPYTRVHHLDRIGSDHCPIMLQTDQHHKDNRIKPFRFLAAWMEHPNFVKFLKKEWAKHNDFLDSLNHIRQIIGIWNRETFGSINQKKRRIISRLKGIDKALRKYNSNILSNIESELKTELDTILRHEELLWAQRAR